MHFRFFYPKTGVTEMLGWKQVTVSRPRAKKAPRPNQEIENERVGEGSKYLIQHGEA